VSLCGAQARWCAVIKIDRTVKADSWLSALDPRSASCAATNSAPTASGTTGSSWICLPTISTDGPIGRVASSFDNSPGNGWACVSVVIVFTGRASRALRVKRDAGHTVTVSH